MMSLIATGLFIIFIGLLYKFLSRNSGYWEKKDVPNEKPLPLIGNIANVISGKESLGMAVKRFYDNVNENVPYFGFYVFQTPYLVLKCPELIKQILITDFNAFPNRTIYSNEKLDPVQSNVLFALKNDAWRELRRKLTPIFTSGKLKMMFPLIKEITNELDDHLQEFDGEPIDVKELSKKYSVDTISSCAFGINSNSIKNQNSEIYTMVNKLFDMTKFKRAISATSYFFCPILVKIFRLSFLDMDAAQYLIDIFKRVSEDRKKMKVKRCDLIDCLHTIQQEETEADLFKFDDVKMSAQSITFFNAGSEPAALIISFLLYELAINPYIQERLRAEIQENLDSDGSISYETLNEMKYLDMVIKEALRKYPLTQLLFRRAEEDYVFESTGLRIEKGTPILIPTLALHLDPNHYPDPDKFDPERFRDRCDNSTFMPFGIGPRKCIADRFAVMQIKTAAVMLFKKFEVSPCEKTEIPMKLNMRSFFMMPQSGYIYLNVKKLASGINSFCTNRD